MKDLQYIKGVGPKRIKSLNKLGINTIGDLLYFFPKDYEKRKIIPINMMSDGEKQTIRARVSGNATEVKVRGNMTITKIPVSDGISVANIVYFNQPYIKKNFIYNKEYILTGKVSIKFGEIQMITPEINSALGIVPVYRLTEGISSSVLRTIFDNVKKEIDEIPDFLPESIRTKYSLINLNKAIKQMHFPTSEKDIIDAKKRLSFDELFILQLCLMLIKNKTSVFVKDKKMKYMVEIDSFIENLPFKMTNAQLKTWAQVKQDMTSDKVMNRLVLGDVGSGKTLIAILACYLTILNGFQAAFMAPTEILAEQHFKNIKKYFEKMAIKIALLTGNMPQKEKSEAVDDIKNGSINLVIGTHAIIQDEIKFKNLGLIITDEQHRFGVRQRALLSQKGDNPDMLIMTATPIPRTLALVLYGDLDVSLIDEMPPGRKRIMTYALDESMSERVYAFVRKNVNEGRQAYVVCPLIEESETIDAKSALKHYEFLTKHYLKGLNVKLLHGKLSNSEKDEIMKSFVEGETDILVSTTVVEVGIDVANATVIVIENAERFGLAQLHQLRGRVGRGEHQSYCFLISQMDSENAKARMEAMVRSQNGFEIAEKDMALRGPGEFLGLRQHGMTEFKVSDLSDVEILKISHEAALDVLKTDADFKRQENQLLKKMLMKKYYEKLKNIILN